MIKQKQYILGLQVTFWITFHTAKHYFSTILPVILELFIKNGSHEWRASCIWTNNFNRLQEVEFHSIKDALSSLRKFLETESPLKMLKNAFHPKVGFSPSKKMCYLLHWKPFKNDEKCFLFHLKSSFHPKDI